MTECRGIRYGIGSGSGGMVVGRAAGIVPVDEAHLIAFVFHEFNGVTVVDVREEFSQCGADFIFPVFPEIIFARVSGRERKNLARHGQQSEQCGKRLVSLAGSGRTLPGMDSRASNAVNA